MLLGPRDSISNIFFLITRWVISSLWILSPKPFAVFLNFALFLPWGQARDSIQGPLVSDQLDSIPNLGLNPWLQAKVHKQPLLGMFFVGELGQLQLHYVAFENHIEPPVEGVSHQAMGFRGFCVFLLSDKAHQV